jgi:hypothetical protein
LKFWKKKANIILVLLLITGLLGFVLGASGSATKLSYLALGAGGVVFNDGFENSNFDAWSATADNPLITSQIYCSGAYAMDGSQGYVYKALDNGFNDLFLGFSVYFSSIPTDSYSLLGSIWDGNFGDEVTVAACTFGSSSWDLNVNGVGYQFLAPINAGQWYNLVVERSDSGAANLWVDDVNVLSVSGSFAGSAQIFRVGGGWGDSTIYDDVEVSIGGFPSLPTPTPVTTSPTPMPTASPSPTIVPTPTAVPSPGPIIVPRSNTNTVVAGLGAATSFLAAVGLAVFNKKW